VAHVVVFVLSAGRFLGVGGGGHGSWILLDILSPIYAYCPRGIDSPVNDFYDLYNCS